jgi:excisionase family DNA binding protein
VTARVAVAERSASVAHDSGARDTTTVDATTLSGHVPNRVVRAARSTDSRRRLSWVRLGATINGGAPMVTRSRSTPGEAQSRRESRVASQRLSERMHMTVKDICEELGVARSTFYDWRAAHKAPPCLKLPNGDLRIRRADFDRWLESLEQQA